ncbi:unnamed protein product [Hymenolepis diminuta]|uniref:Tetraspanin n=1 Tax=Hymenolepis diminuta TaxID=6216 RepID=A0A0R3SGX8_HYMDI|nr:unnamed protein product [Hymenolepis diminuta]VUZ46385.1 unnamed protein product [Hymenolepis diminuta]
MAPPWTHRYTLVFNILTVAVLLTGIGMAAYGIILSYNAVNEKKPFTFEVYGIYSCVILSGFYGIAIAVMVGLCYIFHFRILMTSFEVISIVAVPLLMAAGVMSLIWGNILVGSLLTAHSIFEETVPSKTDNDDSSSSIITLETEFDTEQSHTQDLERSKEPPSILTRYEERSADANGSPIKTYGQKSITLDLGLHRTFRWIFIIADVSEPIIGSDFLSHFGLLLNLLKKLLDHSTSLCLTYSSITFIQSSESPFYFIL